MSIEVEQKYWNELDKTNHPLLNEINGNLSVKQLYEILGRIHEDFFENKSEYYVKEINQNNFKGYVKSKYINLYINVYKNEEEKLYYLDYYIGTMFKNYEFSMKYPKKYILLHGFEKIYFINRDFDYFCRHIEDSYEIANKHNLKCTIIPQTEEKDKFDNFLLIYFYFSEEKYILFRPSFTEFYEYYDPLVKQEDYLDYIPGETLSSKSFKKQFKDKEICLSQDEYLKNREESINDFKISRILMFKDDEDEFNEDIESEDGETEDGESEDGESEDDETEDGESEDGESEDDETEDGESEDGESEDEKAINYTENGNYISLIPPFDPVVFVYVTRETSNHTKKFLIKENEFNDSYFEDKNINTYVCIPYQTDIKDRMENLILAELLNNHTKKNGKLSDVFNEVLSYIF